MKKLAGLLTLTICSSLLAAVGCSDKGKHDPPADTDHIAGHPADADVTSPAELPASRDSGVTPDATSCTTRACLCSTYCEILHGSACLDMPEEQTFCLETCRPEPDVCAEEDLASLACTARQPASQYACDPATQDFNVMGCEAESSSLLDCILGE